MGITLFKRKLKGGKYSLYLNIYYNGKRKKEALGLILEAGKDRKTQKANNQKLNIARTILIKRELDYLKFRIFGKELQKENMTATHDSQTNLIKIFRLYVNNYNKSDKRLVDASLNHLCKYASSGIIFAEQVNKRFCSGFLDYLFNNLHGNTPSHYFKKFKQFLNYCVEEGFLAINPAVTMHAPQCNAVTKSILTAEEITLLAKTPCNNKEVKRAFLFACHSGLRWCDITRLRYSNIDFSSHILTMTQKKVSSHSSQAVLHLNLNSSALRMIGNPPINRERQVFDLPTYDYTLKSIKEWTIKAGIKKHISFHCARHTFITLLMSNGTGIKIAAAIAGHSSTRHTEKYIHIIDKQKQEAVDKLPQLPPDIV